MTNNWFECKIKYEKTLEEGKIQTVNESYLVFAFSFTDAEARIIEEMKPFISGEFEVGNIKKVRLWELFDDGEGDRWYRCKVYLITLDEESGTEKKKGISVLVHASNVKEAWDVLTKGMDGTLSDYEVAAIVETPLMDVYRDMVAPEAAGTGVQLA